MLRYIMSITAQDRPGIIAGISEALLHLSGNIEAASQTVHQGYFAMIILCSLPEPVPAEELAGRIRQTAGQDLHVYVTPYEPNTFQTDPAAQTFIVTAVGPDRPGILHALSACLAQRQVNITDHYARVENGDFVVICQVSVPPCLDIFSLQADLEATGKKLGFSAQMQHENIFVAINELRFGAVR